MADKAAAPQRRFNEPAMADQPAAPQRKRGARAMADKRGAPHHRHNESDTGTGTCRHLERFGRTVRLQFLVALVGELLAVAAAAQVMASAVADRLAVLGRASVWLSRWLAHDGFRSCGSLGSAGRGECLAEPVVGR